MAPVPRGLDGLVGELYETERHVLEQGRGSFVLAVLSGHSSGTERRLRGLEPESLP